MKPKPEPKPRGVFKNGSAWIDSPATRDARIAKRHPACTICNHPDRHLIEATKVAGGGLDAVAERFSVHRDALWRHMKNHVSEETKIGYLAGPAKITELANLAADENKSLLEYLTILRSILFGMLDKSAQRDKPYEVDKLAGRTVEVLREIGKVTGEVSQFASTIVNVQNNNVQILNSEPFLELQTGLLEVCVKHPDARADIIKLFRDLDARHAVSSEGQNGSGAATSGIMIEHHEAAE